MEVTGVTLLNSAFWTFHPTYCKDVWIHHMTIQVPWLAHVDGQNISGFNGDGIDVGKWKVHSVSCAGTACAACPAAA